MHLPKKLIKNIKITYKLIVLNKWWRVKGLRHLQVNPYKEVKIFNYVQKSSVRLQFIVHLITKTKQLLTIGQIIIN